MINSSVHPDSSAQQYPILWEQMLDGDTHAFERLYRDTFSKLYRYGCRFASPEIVENVLQDLFIHLWNKKSHLPTALSPVSYLMRSLRNRLINYNKQVKKTRMVSLESMADFNYQIEESLGSQQSDILQKAINRLSPQQREVIYLLYFNELSVTEVADILDLKVRTVYNTSHNAINVLRKIMVKDNIVSYLVLFSFFFRSLL